MLEVALVELVGCGVLECAYRRHTDTQFTTITLRTANYSFSMA